MARSRTIKREFWQDEKLGPLSPLDRLVFIGLISQADDAGRLVDSVRMLNGLLFPFTEDDCAPSLVTLAAIGVIKRGVTASGQRVVQLVNWQKHQRVEKANLRSALPPICEPSSNGPGQIPEPSRNGTGSVGEASETHTYDQRPTINDQRPTTADPPGTPEPTHVERAPVAAAAAKASTVEEIGSAYSAMNAGGSDMGGAGLDTGGVRIPSANQRKKLEGYAAMIAGSDDVAAWRVLSRQYRPSGGAR